MKIISSLIQVLFNVSKFIFLLILMALQEALGGLKKIKTTNRVANISKETIKDCRLIKDYSDNELHEIFLD